MFVGLRKFDFIDEPSAARFFDWPNETLPDHDRHNSRHDYPRSDFEFRQRLLSTQERGQFKMPSEFRICDP